MTLPAIVGDLDQKIAPLVHALRAAGFPTTSSCDGEGSWQGVPWVNVSPANGIYGAQMAHAVIGWCRAHHITANVCAVRSTLPDVETFVRLEVLSDLSEARLG